MNVIVLGAGAIGSLYAAKLSARHHVVVLAREAHAAAINRNGLRVVGLEDLTCRVEAVTRVDAIAPGTLLLLTSKVPANRAIAESIADSVGQDTPLVCIQNGLGGEEVVRAVFAGRAPVLRGITQFGAIFREPGVVDYKAAGHTLIERGPYADAIAMTLTECGLAGRISTNIAVDVWRKLIFNCVINPITSIVGGDVGSIAEPGLDPLKQLVVDECVAVAGASGVDCATDFMKALVEVFGPSRNIASMRQDLLQGKATEIDFMNGAVVDAGRRAGIDCPVNAALVAIIKAMERRGPFVVP